MYNLEYIVQRFYTHKGYLYNLNNGGALQKFKYPTVEQDSAL